MKMTSAAAVAVILVAIMAAPVSAQSWQNKRPTIWSEADDKRWSRALQNDPLNMTLKFCQNYRRGRAGGAALTVEDFKEYEFVFDLVGMNAKDISLLRSRSKKIAIGQSFLGLMCSQASLLETNRAFYQGVGHRWQVVLSGPRYIYLEGDGTIAGMKVTGWN